MFFDYKVCIENILQIDYTWLPIYKAKMKQHHRKNELHQAILRLTEFMRKFKIINNMSLKLNNTFNIA